MPRSRPLADEQYLHEQHLISTGKYTYFLLAAAAAAISLALNRTTGHGLTPSHIVLGIAVLCWGASFYFGCRYIESGQSVLRTNHALLKAQAKPRTPLTMVEITELSRIVTKHSNASGKYSGRQVRWLLFGAGFYVAWHLLGMALCTPSFQTPLAPLGSCVQVASGHQ